MACSCGGKKASGSQTYVVTAPNGNKTTYSTAVEAAAAAQRVGGTYRAQ